MQIDILIATADRPQLLRKTLRSIHNTSYNASNYRVLVVDNGEKAGTREVCDQAKQAGMPLQFLREPTGGKSCALNHGLKAVESSLVVFTDDDVIVSDSWLSAIANGVRRWPDHQLFGGRVLPRWPESPEEWLSETKYAGVLFSVLNPSWTEGPHSSLRPFGPNFAVRRTVFESGLRFDPSIGPAPGDYVMGNETELAERIIDRGRDAVFLPKSVVYHRIREEQLSLRWMFKRVQKYGRGRVFHDNRSLLEKGSLGTAPAWLYSGAAEHLIKALLMGVRGNRVRAFDYLLDVFDNIGQIKAYHSD